MKKRASEYFLRDADCHSHRCVSSVPEFNLANWNSLWNLTIFLKKVFLWSFSDENAESCHIGILYDILRLSHEVRVERDHKLLVHNILFMQIRVVWVPTLPGDRLCKPGMGGASYRFPLGWELRWASKPLLRELAALRLIGTLSVTGFCREHTALSAHSLSSGRLHNLSQGGKVSHSPWTDSLACREKLR